MSWKRTILFLTASCLVALPAAADWSAGLAAFNAGDLRTAETEFRAITDTQPEWAGGHLMLGQTLLQDGRTSEAVAAFERAHQLDPGNIPAAFALGHADVMLKRFAKAAEVLAGVDPAAVPKAQRLTFLKDRVAAFTGAGQASKGLPDLEAAVEIEPNDAGLHRKLAQAAKAAGRTDLAITQFGHAARLDPQDNGSVEGLVELLFNRAITADETEQPKLCEQVLPYARRLVDLDDSYEHLVLVAKVATCMGRNDVSRDALNAAVTARPGDWRARAALGRTYVNLEAWPEARAAFEDALTKDVPAGEKADVEKRLGYVFERMEKLHDALAQYRLAGDTVSATRVEKNIAADEEAARIAALAAEKARIEKQLAELEKHSGI